MVAGGATGSGGFAGLIAKKILRRRAASSGSKRTPKENRQTYSTDGRGLDILVCFLCGACAGSVSAKDPPESDSRLENGTPEFPSG